MPAPAKSHRLDHAFELKDITVIDISSVRKQLMYLNGQDRWSCLQEPWFRTKSTISVYTKMQIRHLHKPPLR